MSDTIDGYKDIAEHRKWLRATYGVECPKCLVHRPKANASILLPGQKCRVDGYRDPRPDLTDEQYVMRKP